MVTVGQIWLKGNKSLGNGTGNSVYKRIGQYSLYDYHITIIIGIGFIIPALLLFSFSLFLCSSSSSLLFRALPPYPPSGRFGSPCIGSVSLYP